ncbi:hypothetical protein [Paraburkholderia largidicola]|uniref:Uncharacterized protein n=1 Tax=Paraburkholderia largidicola TaxID=3014751 RepID=A0A7I8C6L4_9BURK|nr:hypothetical protein [Paraburkholderia sp. PGU16]BCF95400.1 hypothetical protein PPGU16_84670 [Paraburkholderia sp. PGU16]
MLRQNLEDLYVFVMDCDREQARANVRMLYQVDVEEEIAFFRTLGN